MLSAVAVAWFAIDRAQRTTHALAERSREQRELFDTMLRRSTTSGRRWRSGCTTAPSRR